MKTTPKTPPHPSGLSQERWDWPFKTEQERKLVAKYFNRKEKIDVRYPRATI